jgi:hypothetical protein
MIIARWQVDVPMSQKTKATDLVKAWAADVGSQIGWKSKNLRVLSGCVGVIDTRLIFEVELDSLEEFGASLGAKGLGAANIKSLNSKHMDSMAELMIPGTSKWELYRVE